MKKLFVLGLLMFDEMIQEALENMRKRFEGKDYWAFKAGLLTLLMHLHSHPAFDNEKLKNMRQEVERLDPFFCFGRLQEIYQEALEMIKESGLISPGIIGEAIKEAEGVMKR